MGPIGRSASADPVPAESHTHHVTQNKNREEKRWRRQLEKERQDDVVKDSAATLSCAAETAGDFAYQCTYQQEN
jgi:plastocyanin